MRSNISTICGLPNQPNALAVISYGSSNTTDAAYTTKKPSSVAWPFTDTNKCNNVGAPENYISGASTDLHQHPLNNTTPVFPMPIKTPTMTINLGVNSSVNATGHLLWTINDQTFRDDYGNPILLLANQKNGTNVYNPYWNVYDLGTNSTVRLIVQNEQSAATNISHVGVDLQTGKGDATLILIALSHAWS